MSKITETISNLACKTGFELKKKSPEILVVAGIVGVVSAAVLACRATLKAKPVIEDHKKKVEAIHRANEEAPDVYSDKAKDKDITRQYLKTGWELSKLYGPSVILGTVSIASILGSHKILSDRNMATAAAYTALSETLRNYRGRVAKTLGEEKEKKIWFTSEEEIEEDVSADNKKKKKPLLKKEAGPYARIFDAAQPGWDPNPEISLYFLRAVRTSLQSRLESRGHLFLNEAYDALGFPRSEMGQYVGWIYDPADPNRSSWIDFGIYDIHDREKKNFIDGDEQNIILDFNVDGVISDKIDKIKQH